MTRTFTAIIYKEDDWYSGRLSRSGKGQPGKTVEEAGRRMLREELGEKNIGKSRADVQRNQKEFSQVTSR